MIQELKTYLCGEGTPTDADIQEAIDIVKRDGTVIKLMWNIRHSGTYSAFVAGNSTIESVRAQMPRVYGM